MIEIPGWLAIIFEQLLILFLILFGVFFYKTRKLKKQILVLQQTNERLLLEQKALSNNNDEITELKNKVALYEQSLKNLEKFRDMFFDMKRKYDAYAALQVQVISQIENVLTEDESSKSLRKALEQLTGEKERLEQHLKQVVAELDLLMEEPGHAETAVPAIEDTVADVGDLLGEQQAEIQRLKQYVVDLTLESAIKDQLGASLTGLENKNNELATALEILQDENQFLMDQIQALLQMDQTSAGKSDNDVSQLQQDLQAKEKEFQTLQQKFVALETEYLELSQKK